MLRRLFLIALALAALAVTSTAWAGGCGVRSYSYAGFGSRAAVSGISATITPGSGSAVRDGHIAGWIGVGGVGAGPGGANAWIQIGLSAFAGDAGSRVYYEVARPGRKRVYRELLRGVQAGQTHRFVVLELRQRPDWWRAWLDGSPVTAPVYLPGSHARFTAQALGESLTGDADGTCNLFAYGFGDVAVASPPGGAWGPVGALDAFQDGNYRFTRSSLTSFDAASVAAVVSR